VIEASEFLGQLSIRIEPAQIVDVCRTLKDDADSPFNYLSDLTCAHYPDHREAPFEVIYNLYSISANERVRLKVAVDRAGIGSVTGVWPSADWPEREVLTCSASCSTAIPICGEFFCRRIGKVIHCARIIRWNLSRTGGPRYLPEFTDVQKEQLEQRRAYGLEMLSIPQEREVRELFKSGKEVMPKDK